MRLFSRTRIPAIFLIISAALLSVAGLYLRKAVRAEFAHVVRSQVAPPPALPAKVSGIRVDDPLAMPPAPQVVSSAGEKAQKLIADLDKTAWGASLQDWSTSHADIHCAAFHGRMWSMDADRQWSHKCSSSREREAGHWSFYVFDSQEPLVPRLEQFDETTSSLPEEALGELRKSLQTSLTSRYGSPEDRTRKVGGVSRIVWPRYLSWKTPDLEFQLNLSEFDPARKEGRLQLLGRHRPLLEALNEDERIKRVGANDFLYQAGSGIDKQLADALRPDFSDVAAMLVKNQPDPDPEKMRAAVQQAIQQRQNQLRSAPSAGHAPIAALAIAVPQASWSPEDFHNALLRLLTNVKQAPPERQPIFLFSADRLAGRLPWAFTGPFLGKDWTDWREQLASYGVIYQRDEERQAWAYSGDLLKRVWTDYPDTQWGERAFLLLLDSGWNTRPDCSASSDQFRAVIQQGVSFLEKHPNSPYRLDVQLVVAQAYETWWSLNQALPPEERVDEIEPDADPRRYQEGAAAARQKAIEAYDQLLQTAPQSDQAVYARRVLPRLKLGLDTGQRRFYCIELD
jgi:hypothetical protein